MYKPGQLSVLCIQTVLALQLTRREPLNEQRVQPNKEMQLRSLAYLWLMAMVQL